MGETQVEQPSFENHKWLISIFSKTTEDNNLQFHSRVGTDGLHTMTGNDVISYFPSAANCVNVSLSISQFLDNRSTDFEKVGNFGNGRSNASLLVVRIIRYFAP